MLQRFAAVLAVLSAVTLAIACIADVSDEDPDDPALEPEGVHYGQAGPHPDPAKPGIVDPPEPPPGPCTTACSMVRLAACGHWREDCEGVDPNALWVTCGETYLTCAEADHAAENTLTGTTWCYRGCEGLR